ncbi:MAG: beta-1,3-glucanase family protein [Cyclobacteriaceae bacterium]
MKTKLYQNAAGLSRYLLLGVLMLLTQAVMAQTLPYQFVNNSAYADNEIYVAIVGIQGGHVWVDPTTGQVNPMSQSDNTVQGPVYGGNFGPGENGLYANCFRRLSDIPGKTVNIPKIAGCRIMISFQSQLYLYFFGYNGDPQGYAAPNLQNETDPNQGIKFELVELTYNDFGLWCNTSRVDSYQYPMGLEVWGNGFYKKIGELKTHQQILSDWQNQAPSEFQGLLDQQEGMIHFPTKTSVFPTNFMQGYIDAIWNKYSSDELVFNSGQAGVWRGRVQGSQFVFTRDGDGQVAVIPGKPNTLEAMEGSGVLATGGQWDLVVQAQFVAAITRHAIDLSAPSGTYQDFGDVSRYYQTWPYNWYAKFLHQTSISNDGLTYAFAYDDVFDRSATIHTPGPNNIRITVGGFAGISGDGGGGFSQQIEAENFALQSGQMQTEACSEGGQNVGWLANGGWLVYDVDLPSSGAYTVEYRVASPNGNGVIQLEQAGGSPVFGQVSVPNTGGWQNWTTVSHTVNMNAGQQQVAIYIPASGYNINWLRISSASGARTAPATDQTTDLQKPHVFPNPASEVLNIRGFGPDASYSIYDLRGQEVLRGTLSSDTGNGIDVSNLQPGTYLIRELTSGETLRFIKQ